MAKVKLTKNALKAQRDELKRFQRYLPTLQLKKQQLQLEMRQLQAKVEAKRLEEEALLADMSGWVKLFAEPFPWTDHLRVVDVRQGEGNIAGVTIPVFDGVDFERTRLANGAKGIAQHIDGFLRSQNRPAAIRHEGEEKGAAGNDGALIVHGRCRVTLR